MLAFTKADRDMLHTIPYRLVLFCELNSKRDLIYFTFCSSSAKVINLCNNNGSGEKLLVKF